MRVLGKRREALRLQQSRYPASAAHATAQHGAVRLAMSANFSEMLLNAHTEIFCDYRSSCKQHTNRIIHR